MSELLKDLTGSVVWAFQALMAAAAFSAIAILSHADWELLTHIGVTARADSSIAVPLTGLSVAYVAFFAVGPVVLFFMQLYLLIQAHAVLVALGVPEGDARPDSGLLQNHLSMWPFSILGLACYVIVPVTNALFVWKIWPRQFADSPLPASLAPFLPQNLVQGVPYVFFLLSCAVAAAAAWRDRKYIPPRTGMWEWLNSALALDVVLCGLILGLGISLRLARHLELRGAPLDLADLREFNLRGADFTNAHLSGAQLAGAYMSGATMDAAWLDSADLRAAKLDGAILSRARLNDADLRGACLSRALLDDAEIEGADFRYAWMPGVWLRPRPRTPPDRTKMSEHDRTYDEQGKIELAHFDDAKLCGAHIDFAAWTKDAAVGQPAKLQDAPFYTAAPDPPTWLVLPAYFTDAQPYPADAGDRDLFRLRQTSQCMAGALAKLAGYAAACPDAPPQAVR